MPNADVDDAVNVVFSAISPSTPPMLKLSKTLRDAVTS